MSEAFESEKGKSDVVGATQTSPWQKITEGLGATSSKNVTLHPSTSIGFEVRELVSIERIANAMINHKSR
jgi:hypothetical protein